MRADLVARSDPFRILAIAFAFPKNQKDLLFQTVTPLFACGFVLAHSLLYPLA